MYDNTDCEQQMKDEIWLVSDCPELTQLMEAAVDSTPTTMRIKSSDSFLSEGVPTTVPRAVFYNLCECDKWDKLLQERLIWGNKTVVPFIGIHDARGIALDNVLVAHRICAKFLDQQDITGKTVTETLQQARVAELDMGKIRLEGTRYVECGDRKFVSGSALVESVFDELELVAKHDIAVLLIGETGTGKTSLARLIHEMSPQSKGKLIHVACGALPRDIIDSELFGHVKGAFTGAQDTRIGKFEAASGGTILLDEIDTLDIEQQAKLLRILESNEFEKLGSHNTQISDARVIVASNVCLEELVKHGKFRADLFFRLNQVKFQVPPLRKRLNDLPGLVVEVLNEFKRLHSFRIDAVLPESLEVLKDYHWPGNIRELRNELRRAALFCRDGIIEPSCMNSHIREHAQEHVHAREGQANNGLSGFVEKTEREAIEEMLNMQENNRTATARALGISRVTLYKKIRKYGIRLAET